MLKRMNIFAIFCLIALVVSASNVAAIHTGWGAPDETINIKNPYASKSSAASEGKKVYLENCEMCHGKNGKGDGSSALSLQIELPDFTDKEMTMLETDGQWFWKVRNGLFEMPPFQLALTDDQIWKSIVFIRTLVK
jgi:mono/diheme cytochrome c family protein